MKKTYKYHKKKFDLYLLEHPEILESGEEYRQVYTTNKSDKFYKVRSQFPKFWFISNYGNLISTWHKEPQKLNTSLASHDESRERYEMAYKGCNIKIDPCILVAITFNAYTSKNALKSLQQHGVRALYNYKKKKAITGVRGHHVEGYKKGSTKSEIEKLRRENSRLYDLNNKPLIQLLTEREHALLHSMPKANQDVKKEIKYMKKLMQLDNGMIRFLDSNGQYREIDPDSEEGLQHWVDLMIATGISELSYVR